jgi:hypothetical protein
MKPFPKPLHDPAQQWRNELWAYQSGQTRRRNNKITLPGDYKMGED